MSIKVMMVGGGFGSYSRMFLERGFCLTNDYNQADLVQFTGGEDVSPSLYGEAEHPLSFCNPHRDAREQAIYETMVARGVPMAGICRGGQFLNVVNGGSMYQHVDNHGRPHVIYDTETNKEICLATSTHHQMMIAGKHGKVLAFANESAHRECMVGKSILEYKGAADDTEVVYYDATKCLCFQPHPEIGPKELKDYYFSLLEQCFGIVAPGAQLGATA